MHFPTQSSDVRNNQNNIIAINVDNNRHRLRRRVFYAATKILMKRRREKQSDATLLPAKTSRLRENLVSREVEVLGKIMCLGEPDSIVTRDTISKENIEEVSVSKFLEKSTTYII